MTRFDFKWLQMFAEGGEGGEGTGASISAEAAPSDGTQAMSGEQSPSDAQMDSVMSRIPERGKKAFKEAYEQTHKKNAPVEQTVPETTHIPYADLIKSEEYKAEHKAWADKAFSERFKAKDNEIAGLKQNNAKMRDALTRLAPKYGLDPNSENYLEQMTEKLANDDSIYEDYAVDHGMSIEEAKRSIELEAKVQRMEAEENQRQADDRNRRLTQALLYHADNTKRQFADFDLDKEWQNPEFRRQCFNNNMDTTIAYQIVHMNEIMHRNTAQVANQTKVAIANSIASGKNRPLESGLSNSSTAEIRTTPNFDGMTTKQMREYAEKNLIRRR